jgi:hypothetical protein
MICPNYLHRKRRPKKLAAQPEFFSKTHAKKNSLQAVDFRFDHQNRINFFCGLARALLFRREQFGAVWLRDSSGITLGFFGINCSTTKDRKES